MFLEPLEDVADFFLGDGVGEGDVAFKARGVACLLQVMEGEFGGFDRDDVIGIAVEDADGKWSFAGWCRVGAGLQEVAGHGEDAGDFFLIPQADVQGHGGSLGKAGEDDLWGGLGGDEGFDLSLACLDGGPVDFAWVAEVEDVVPGGHLVTHVDGHGNLVRVREDEAPAFGLGGLAKHGGDVFEVMAVGSEAVHEDHAKIGVGFCGADFEVLKFW